MDTAMFTFMEREIAYLTVLASFQRVRIYSKDVAPKARSLVQRALKEELKSLARRYAESPVPDGDHCSNIKLLAKRISSAHSNVLQDGRFRIGVAQKALNLYLKYLWCLGQIPEPPHCPFDRTIISKLGLAHISSWARMDDIRLYRKWVKAARKLAGESSLSRWELDLFNAAQQGAVLPAPSRAPTFHSRPRRSPTWILRAARAPGGSRALTDQRRPRYDASQFGHPEYSKPLVATEGRNERWTRMR